MSTLIPFGTNSHFRTSLWAGHALQRVLVVLAQVAGTIGRRQKRRDRRSGPQPQAHGR